MARQFNVDSTLKWRTPDKKLTLVEYNAGDQRAYVPSHDFTAAGLRALAAACLDVANYMDEPGPDSEDVERIAAQVEAFAQALPEPPLAPERKIIGVVPASALQVQAVSAPVVVNLKDDEEDLGPPVEVRREPRAPQGPLPGAAPRARNVYPTGGYGV